MNKAPIVIESLGVTESVYAGMRRQRDADVEYYEPLIKKMYEALKRAREHLEYCGYGDKWERECAYDSKLPETIEKALAQVGDVNAK